MTGQGLSRSRGRGVGLLWATFLLGLVAVLVGLGAPTQPLPMAPAGHSLRAFELAFNWSRCGTYPYYSEHSPAIRDVVADNPAILDVPIRSLPDLIGIPANEYCASVTQPFLNNENGLTLVYFAFLETFPALTLNELGLGLRVLELSCVAVFAILLLALGLGPVLTVLAVLVAAHLLADLNQSRRFALYPLILPTLLVYATALIMAGRAAARRRWVGALAAFAVAGLLAGFYYNLRTSHAPLIGAALLLTLAAAAAAYARGAAGVIRRRRLAAVVTVALLWFSAGAYWMNHLLTAPRPAAEFTPAMRSYHVFAHPLVLSLALPPNALAQREGIQWLDAIGLDLARRVDPNAVYLGDGYEAALWTYYWSLWQRAPREMLAVYRLKWQTAGRSVLGYIKAQHGLVFAALAPAGLLAGGVGLTLFWVGGLGFVWFRRRAMRVEVVLGGALLCTLCLLLLFESALIYSEWKPHYQYPLVFGVALTALCVYQFLVNGALAMIRTSTGDNGALARQTIADFGNQWTTYSDTSGLFGSVDLLADFIAPFPIERFRGARVADIGAGTGRHTRALLAAGAAQVVAVEPSQAVEVIRAQVVPAFPDRVTVLNCPGDELPPTGDLDYAISVGVLHHIPEPVPVVAAVYRGLRPGGQFVAWLYGKEGNAAYLRVVGVIRPISTRLPPRAAAVLAWLLDLPLVAYMALCRWLPGARLPLSDYLNNVLGRLPGDKRRLVIYDQIKPRYAKYYTREEAMALLSTAPFVVEVHPRRGFSWVVIGTKPGDQQP